MPSHKRLVITEKQAYGLYYAAKSGNMNVLQQAVDDIDNGTPFDISHMLQRAKEYVDRMTPAEREAMYAAQRESWSKQYMD
jgi:hypothetical protein